MIQSFYSDKIDLSKIKLDLSEKPLTTISEELYQRLHNSFKLMKAEQSSQQSVYIPQGEWNDYNQEKAFFYNPLLEGEKEVSVEILQNFWRNQLGLIVKEYATFDKLSTGDQDEIEKFTKSIYRNYIIWKDLYNDSIDKVALNSTVGNPWGCIIEDHLVAPKAFRYYHNAQQIFQLLDIKNGNIVAEIGAGYGALATFLHRLSKKKITYLDFDLPETLILAAYYLLSNFPDKKIFLYGDEDLQESKLNEYDIILLPNYYIDKLPAKSIDVFFNSFSLSEMSKSANEHYINQISRLTKGYFLHNNMDRAGVVNRGSERIPASTYPINENQFKLLMKSYDVFHAHNGDYKEFLYQVV
jgi:putative sugar O-methyltransferase